MTQYLRFRARVERTRAKIPTMTRDQLLAHSAGVRRAGDIAAFMGDDQPTSDLLHGFARELEDAAKQKEETK